MLFLGFKRNADLNTEPLPRNIFTEVKDCIIDSSFYTRKTQMDVPNAEQGLQNSAP